MLKGMHRFKAMRRLDRESLDNDAPCSMHKEGSGDRRRSEVCLDNLDLDLSFSIISRWCLRYLLTVRPNPYGRPIVHIPFSTSSSDSTGYDADARSPARGSRISVLCWSYTRNGFVTTQVLAMLLGFGTRFGLGQNWMS